MKKLPPPLIMFAAIGLEWLLNKFIPIVDFKSSALNLAGFVIIVVALLLTLTSLRLFAKSHTTLAPHKNPDKFIASGPYKLSRNPMYLALTGVLVGTALIFGGLSGLAVPAIFVGIITKVYIEMEEANMSSRFGADYKEYLGQVRRWI